MGGIFGYAGSLGLLSGWLCHVVVVVVCGLNKINMHLSWFSQSVVVCLVLAPLLQLGGLLVCMVVDLSNALECLMNLIILLMPFGVPTSLPHWACLPYPSMFRCCW